MFFFKIDHKLEKVIPWVLAKLADENECLQIYALDPVREKYWSRIPTQNHMTYNLLQK